MDLEARIDPRDLASLYQQAKAAEGTLQVELRRGIKNAAKPLVAAVKESASFSSRIPGAVGSKVSFSRGSATVTVVVDPKKAPEAAPLNNKDHSGTFRHPVFGNRENWVAQPAHPFFLSGIREAAPAVDREMLAVMDRVAKALGFK